MNIKEQIQNIVSAIENGQRPFWGVIGELLDQVEQSGHWQNSASSFSEWLRNNTAALGSKEGTLWRYLSASRIYNRIREDNPMFIRLETPPLSEADHSISAENIEYLYKLSRVMRGDEHLSLALKTLNGKSTRTELRNLWETYRPILAGRTARGRGVTPPQIDSTDAATQKELIMASALSALLQSGSKWIGLERCKNFSIFPQVEIKHLKTRPFYDAVAVTRENEEEPLCIHGIIATEEDRLVTDFERLTTLLDYCDRIWLLFHKAPEDLFKISDFVGVLLLENDKIVTLRQAEPSKEVGSDSGEMAKTLLLKSLKR